MMEIDEVFEVLHNAVKEYYKPIYDSLKADEDAAKYSIIEGREKYVNEVLIAFRDFLKWGEIGYGP